MSITVHLELGYEFEVKASFKEVFNVLSDVPASASFYPGVEELVDLGGGTYRWEMEPIGVAQIHLQTVYASNYISNRAKGTVVWTPVANEGNAQVSGSWKINKGKSSTKLVLAIEAAVAIPLPGLMEIVVAPVVEAEFERMTEQYIDNLIEHFGGEVDAEQ